MLLRVKKSNAAEDLLEAREAIGKQDLCRGKGALRRRLGHEDRCGDYGGPFGGLGRRRIEREVTSPNSKANPVPLQLATIQAPKEDWQGLLWHNMIL
jgi:hypothetical protein